MVKKFKMSHAGQGITDSNKSPIDSPEGKGIDGKKARKFNAGVDCHGGDSLEDHNLLNDLGDELSDNDAMAKVSENTEVSIQQAEVDLGEIGELTLNEIFNQFLNNTGNSITYGDFCNYCGDEGYETPKQDDMTDLMSLSPNYMFTPSADGDSYSKEAVEVPVNVRDLPGMMEKDLGENPQECSSVNEDEMIQEDNGHNYEVYTLVTSGDQDAVRIEGSDLQTFNLQSMIDVLVYNSTLENGNEVSEEEVIQALSGSNDLVIFSGTENALSNYEITKEVGVVTTLFPLSKFVNS